MTVNQWLLVVVVSLVIFFAPMALTSKTGAEWFSNQGLWSVLAVFSILLITQSKLAITIACIEYAAVLVASFSWYQFPSGSGFFYTYCVEMYDALNILIAVVLIAGAPWNGLAGRFKSMGMGNLFRRTGGRSSIQNCLGNQG